MPQRTNAFQRLIYLLKAQLAGNATVRESELLVDRVTGAEREVDVVIRGSVGEYDVLVSLECRDRGRAADVGWVEEMKAKHERLPTNALVLVSRSGFTQQARQVAQIYGFETLALEEADEAGVARLLGGVEAVWGKAFTLTPVKVLVGVAATINLPAEFVAVFPDNLVYAPNGEELGTVREHVEQLLRSPELIKGLGAQGAPEHRWFEVRYEHPHHREGQPICLMRLEPQLLRPIESIQVSGTCGFAVSEFRLKRAKLGEVHIAWGEGAFSGQPATLVASQARDAPTRVTIDIGPRTSNSIG